MSIQLVRPHDPALTSPNWNQSRSNLDSATLRQAAQLLNDAFLQYIEQVLARLMQANFAGQSDRRHGGGGGHHPGWTGTMPVPQSAAPAGTVPRHANANPYQADSVTPAAKHDRPAATVQPPSAPTTATPSAGAGKVSYGAEPPPPTGVVDVDKPIVVKAGQTFDGGGKYFRPTSAMGDGSQGEHQQAVFILEPGAKLKNVQYSGADGIHLMGDATLDHVVNRKVGEDAITIDGLKNREHDAKIAGIDPASIPDRPAKVQILNSAFYGGKDKIVQDNGDADVLMKGDFVNGAGKVFRTNGGQPLNTHLSVEDSTFTNVKEAIFRTDSKTSTASFSNVDSTNTPVDALAPNKSQVTGTDRVGYKPYSG